MPASQADIQKIIRDPGFQALSDQPEEQIRVVQNYLNQSEEAFGGLAVEEQLRVAAQALDLNSPSTVRRFLDYVPVVGSALRASESAETTRPIARGLLRGLGINPETASGLTRAAASVIGEAGEIAALTPVGGAIARPIIGAASRFIPAGAEALLAQAGTQVAEGAIASAGQTAARSFVARAVDRAITDATIGALFGAADAIETGQLRPFEQFVIDPLAGAALSVLFLGVSRARERFGNARTTQALEALQTRPDIQEQGRVISPLVQAYQRTTHGTLEEAGDVVLRGLREPLNTDEFRVLRSVLTSDAALLKSDVGQRLLMTQREHLLPQVVNAADQTGPLRITIERPGGRHETIIDPLPSDARRIVLEQAAGDLHIISAEGYSSANFIQRARLAIEESYGPRQELQVQLGLPLGDRGTGGFERPLTQVRPQATEGGIQGELFARPTPLEPTGPRQFEPGVPVAETRGLAPTSVPGPGGGPITEGAVPAFPRPQLFEGPGSPGFAQQIDEVVAQVKAQTPPGTDVGSLLVREQTTAALPQELRSLEPAPSAPLRVDTPPAQPQGVSPALQVLLDTAQTEGRTISTQRLQRELGIPFPEAQEERRRLVVEGIIDRTGRPIQTAPPQPPARYTAPPEPGAPAPVPSEVTSGQVVVATPAKTTVQTASGRTVEVVPTAEGTSAEIVKVPGAPATAVEPATTPQARAKRAQKERTLVEIPEMTPEQRRARIQQLDRKLERQGLNEIENTELMALSEFEIEGRLSAQYASVRCRT